MLYKVHVRIGSRHPGNVNSHTLTRLAPAEGVTDLKTIIESALAEYFANGAVKSVVIDETHEGFELHVTLTWRSDGPFRLMTYRGAKPRTWASLDRLIKYLKNFDHIPPLAVHLLPRDPAQGDLDATNED